MTTSAQIRSQLIQALTLDLVGPSPDILDQLELEGRTEEAAELREEVLDRPPNRWYQTGFLIPSETSLGDRADDAADDEFAGLDGQNLSAKRKSNASGDDTGASEAGPARRVFFTCSVGLSLLIPDATGLEVTVHWASYKPTAPPADSNADDAWLREPHRVQLSLPAELLSPSGRSAQAMEVPGSDGLMLRWHLRLAPVDQGYPIGAVAVSLFLTNERSFEGRSAEDRDRASAFQVQLDVACSAGFLERRDPRAADLAINANDWDHRVNNLHYRDDHEFAVGHNISVAPRIDANGHCHQISTTWLPQATVEKVLPRVAELEAGGLVLSMPELDRLASDGADPVQAALRPLVAAYTDWIEQQRATTDTLSKQQQATATELLLEASKQARRIERGIEALENEQVRLAFAIANRTMAAAARQRFGVMRGRDPKAVQPQWRPFQLAFLLMNLVAMAEPTDADHDTIDLLFFPTGGGKTEAYLGLAAYTLVLRRLRHGGSIESAGMAVLMRYTLRLLTLDQLGRASTLICALELERRNDPTLLGQWPFEIGLWVGQSGTPNKLGHKGDGDDNSARSRVLAWCGGDNKPIPIDNCPWCGTELGKASLADERPTVARGVFRLLPDADHPTELRVCCRNRQCRFSGDSTLPLVAVDEMLYQRLPAFVIATVDKFAALPWVGATGKLFGRVSHVQPGKGFFGPSDGTDQAGGLLRNGLEPPDLIIQDELHLISGPLGSMGGLYEAVIDELCARQVHTANGAQIVRPKIVASTATVRHSQLITTYGPGAMVDLPDCSVVIGGLNLWMYGPDQPPEEIDEPRLIAKLRQSLNVGALRLRKPPIHDVGPGGLSRPGGIRSPEFPNWFVAQLDKTETYDGKTYRSRPLVEGARLDKRKYVDADRKAHRVVPVRFVQTCPNGHLSDIDWREFVHRGKTSCRATLWLDEAGAGNDFTEIFVRCSNPACLEKWDRRQLSEAKQKLNGDEEERPALGFCQGHRPWLGPFGQETCDNGKGKGGGYANRLLVRSASNAYFPELISAISIPESIDAVRDVISKHLKAFEKISSAAKLELWLEDYAPDHIKEPLADTTPALIFQALEQALEAIRGGAGAPENTEALKRQELRALVGPIDGLRRGTGSSRFEAEQLDLAAKPAWFQQRVNRVLKVHQLREVMALLGFTRLEPVVSQIDGDPLDLGVKRAQIDVKEATWLPAVENLGEGIFLGCDRDAVRQWLKSDGARQHLSKHRDAFKTWNKEHGLTEDKFQWPGGAYLMLHSLAHLLITEASLDCGYGASAIKERIYAFDDIGYGILLYTGGSGSEGSLGGLVALADRIDGLLALALDRAALCSNDPFCASHEPNSELEKRYAHGAACHGCLLIAETSCERRNEFLDRALVVPTLIQHDAAFFTNGP